MKTLLQFIVVLFFFSSCASFKNSGNSNLGQYDDAYFTPSDEKDIATTNKPTPDVQTPVTTNPGSDDREPDYRKYKEGEGEDIARTPDSGAPNSYNQDDNSGSGNYNYYDEDDDFSYGRSFNRFRYSDGFSDGYQAGLYNNYYNAGSYYNAYYSNPYWGWNRPLRSQFWVGYNVWNGWNIGYNYGYPGWGWRTNFCPVYNNFCDPWFAYPNAWGYYSNPYYGGFGYGYYNPYYSPFYNSWGYYNYGYNGFNSYYGGNWYNQVYNNNVGVGVVRTNNTMYGPRETIGSNSHSTSRNDQVSPRGRGKMVEQIPVDKGNTYDPRKPRDGMSGTTNPGNRGRSMEPGGETQADPSAGSNGRTHSNPGYTDPGTSGNNGTVAPGNEDNSRSRSREIDRTTPDYNGGNNPPSRGNNSPTEYDRNSGNNTVPESRGNNSRRSYEPANTERDRGSGNGNRTYEGSGGNRNEGQPSAPSRSRSRGYDTPPDNSNRNYEPGNTPGTNNGSRKNRNEEQPSAPSRSRSRSYDAPAENHNGGSSRPPENNQRSYEPRSTPRTYDGGGSRGGSSSGGSTSPGSGGGGGGSSSPSRGRGR